jgi:hypothetical protein
MDECQLKGLFYNCDEKYFLGRKCKEKHIFMAISEDVSEEDVDVTHSEDLPQEYYQKWPSDPLKVEVLISLNSLTCLFDP